VPCSGASLVYKWLTQPPYQIAPLLSIRGVISRLTSLLSIKSLGEVLHLKLNLAKFNELYHDNECIKNMLELIKWLNIVRDHAFMVGSIAIAVVCFGCAARRRWSFLACFWRFFNSSLLWWFRVFFCFFLSVVLESAWSWLRPLTCASSFLSSLKNDSRRKFSSDSVSYCDRPGLLWQFRCLSSTFTRTISGHIYCGFD
jgi:hypothetical protein